MESLPQLRPMFRRTYNAEDLKSRIGGYFEELIHLIDADNSGDISSEEFQPIWELMREANLTSAPLEDIDRRWDEFKERAHANDKTNRWTDIIEQGITAFRRSKWNNYLRFRLVSAGQTFDNILWDDVQVGSIATTQKEPLQLYLIPDYSVTSQWPDINDYLSLATAHRGTGDTKVDIERIARQKREEAVEIANMIHNHILEWMMERKSRRKKIGLT